MLSGVDTLLLLVLIRSVHIGPPVFRVVIEVLQAELGFLGCLILEMLLRKESLLACRWLIACSLAEEASAVQEFIVLAFVVVEHLPWAVVVDIGLFEFGSVVQPTPRVPSFLRESLLAWA